MAYLLSVEELKGRNKPVYAEIWLPSERGFLNKAYGAFALIVSVRDSEVKAAIVENDEVCVYPLEVCDKGRRTEFGWRMWSREPDELEKLVEDWDSEV